mmetsp:Transcript_19584/g.48445  ORF Transcript_19584/g.48445 Transcript_19584/m.48445 type:complete len:337 (+) Transcript_19584:460-1470(+)
MPAACDGIRGHVMVHKISRQVAAPRAVASSRACSHPSSGGSSRVRCTAAHSFTAESNAGASATHAAATSGSCPRELAASSIAASAAASPGSRGSSPLTATATATCAAAAAPNTWAADPARVREAASTSAAPCQRSSVRVAAATRATSAAHPSRRTAALWWSIARSTHGTTRDTTPPPGSPPPTRPTQGYPAAANNHCSRTAATTAPSTEAVCNVCVSFGGSSGAGGPSRRPMRWSGSPPHRNSGSGLRQCASDGAASPKQRASCSRAASSNSYPQPVAARIVAAAAPPSLDDARDSPPTPDWGLKQRVHSAQAASAASAELHPGSPPAPLIAAPRA